MFTKRITLCDPFLLVIFKNNNLFTFNRQRSRIIVKKGKLDIRFKHGSEMDVYYKEKCSAVHITVSY